MPGPATPPQTPGILTPSRSCPLPREQTLGWELGVCRVDTRGWEPKRRHVTLMTWMWGEEGRSRDLRVLDRPLGQVLQSEGKVGDPFWVRVSGSEVRGKVGPTGKVEKPQRAQKWGLGKRRRPFLLPSLIAQRSQPPQAESHTILLSCPSLGFMGFVHHTKCHRLCRPVISLCAPPHS